MGQIKQPLEKMAMAWKDLKNRNPAGYSALVTAVRNGDGPAINAALPLLIDDMFVNNNSPFHLIAQDFKDANAGSLLLVFSAGGGAGITVEGSIGLAIDIDYLIFLGKADKSGGYQGPIASLFTAVGLQIGASAGASVDLIIGYDVADPNGVNGPSMDISLEIQVAVGGSVGVGFDMTRVPWMANSAGIGLGAGLQFKLAAGPSYAVILGQLCGNGTFVALARDCPATSQPGGGVTNQPGGVSFKSYHNTYLWVDDRGNVHGGATGLGDWGNFTHINNSNGTVSFKSYHNTYLGVHSDRSVYATGHNQDWEKFTRINNANGTVSFKSYHNTFLGVRSNGSVYATGHNQDWEKFTMSGLGTGSNSNVPQMTDAVCKPQGQAGGFTNIKKVQFKNAQGSVLLLNQQDNHNTAYEDFTGTGSVISANPGDVLTAYIESSHGTDKPTKIWVDRNNNGALTEDELLVNAYIGNTEVSMTIPANMMPGSYRLRIRKGWDHHSCRYDKWTQVEDYVLQIGGSL